jgi:hypothetical protein
MWLAALAVASLVAALALGWSQFVPASLLLVGGVYAAQLAVDDAALDTSAVLVATGLYLAAELAYWSLEERARVRGEPGEALRRLAFVALLGLAAFVVAACLLAVADLVQARGLGIDLLGAAAAAAALLGIVVLARARARESGER